MSTNLTKYLSKAINIIGIFVMFWIFSTILITPTLSPIASEWRYLQVLGAVRTQNILAFIVSILIVVIMYVVCRKYTISKKTGTITIIILSLIYFIFLMLQYKNLNITNAIDDTEIVMNAAKEYLSTGKVSGWYLSANPQNILIMLIYSIIFTIVGSTDLFFVYVFFALLHVFVGLFIYFITANKKNYLLSLISAILFMLTVQLNLHVLYMYTDTLSYVPLMMTFYFLFKTYNIESNQIDNKNLILASFFLSITFLTKGLYLILFIALVIGIIIYFPSKNRLKAIVPIIIFLLVNMTWDSLINQADFLPNDEYGMPNTHYIFMGMNTDYYLTESRREYRLAGGYDHNDLVFSKELFWDKKIPKDEISKIHIKKIAGRLQNHTTKDLLSFFNAKASSTWSSGDLKSTLSLKLATAKSKQSMDIATSGTLNFYMQSLQIVYYLIFFLYFLKALKYRTENFGMSVAGLFMIGIFIFIFMWESSPRYAMTMMPISLLLVPELMSKKN